MALRNVQIVGLLYKSRCQEQTHRCLWLGRTSNVTATKYQGSLSNARPFRAIPGPKGLPYLGTLLDYTFGQHEQYHNALVDNYRKYGSIYKETISGATRLHLFDPDDIRHVYNNAEIHPHTPSILLASKLYRQRRNMALGLGNTNGEEWYRVRHAAQPMMMRPQTVVSYIPRVNDVIDDFISRLKRLVTDSGHVTDFHNELRKWNLESAYNTFMETRLGCLGDYVDPIYQNMINASVNVFEISAKFAFSLGLFKYISTPLWREHVRNEDAFFKPGQKLIDAAVRNLRHLVECGRLEDRYRFLSHMLFNTNLSYNEVSTTTVSFTFDGLNTTVPSMVFVLYCLAKFPDVQEQLYEEIKKILPDKDAAIAQEDLTEMRYLKACIKEALRLFPNITEVTRVPQQDLVLGGYRIPAGTVIGLHMMLMMKLEENVPNATEMTPDRWLRSQHNYGIHPLLATPFGFGNRMCIGRRISEQEMQLLTVRLIQTFRIRWPHEHEMKQKFQLLLFPDCDPDFEFIPRE